MLGCNQNHISVKESCKSSKRNSCCYFQAWVLITKPHFLCLSNLSRAAVFWFFSFFIVLYKLSVG